MQSLVLCYGLDVEFNHRSNTPKTLYGCEVIAGACLVGALLGAYQLGDLV
jgi:hypothetical protein